ncbi:MAG: aminotransferase class I/II-fold pyridoxal phosphate-dependent enzyme [Holophaga sp.]|jgi:histidinol-phosphate/aromatic aminotransferase/cobyric acid decarboxylase-like protein/phosphoglycolate phosphatase-like HAD superfamily hydrolase
MPLIRPEFQQLRGYVRPHGEGRGQDLARLHLNEAAQGWPDGARQALLARLETLPFQHYPEKQEDLTARLARSLGAPEGGVILGPSSGALLDLVLLAGVEPGGTVAFPEPGFSLYPALTTRHGVRAVRVPVGDGFPLDPWLRLLETDPPRQVWITLPNNPTGAWLSPWELEPLLKAAGALPDPPLVVLDEAYAEFAPLSHRLVVDRHPNLVLLRTFSKALASAGWRLGYLVGAPEVIAPLAALQLPYTIPAPALEALDVALDYRAAFAQQARELPARRERLAAALGSRVAASSAANFLYVRPDPGPQLKEAGIQIRALPELGAARITVGTEEETQRVAAALGAELAPPVPRTPRRLLALDMDGVLVDGDPGFMNAVAKALGELAPGLPWMDAHYLAFKQVGGFNNDYRVCAAALALAERGELDTLWSAQAAGFPHLEERIQALEPKCAEVVTRWYNSVPPPDTPLVTLPELEALGWDLAVLTGRNYDELEVGFKSLGFRLPAVADNAPHLRKPEPGGLLQLADTFQAEQVVFVGDTRDDAQALRLAREARPDLVWTFAAVGPLRDTIARESDLRAPSLRALLAILKGAEA